MENLTSLDIYALLEEIGPKLIDARVESVQHIGNEVVLRLFKEGKLELVISSGVGLWLSDYKRVSPKTATSFCMLLRKELKGQRIKCIAQAGFDRIVEVQFENGMKLIAEFFAKGNIVLCDQDYSIVQALVFKDFGSRSIRPKREYLFPKAGRDPLVMGLDEFSESISKSDREIVRALVLDHNIAGHYAESVLAKVGIKKSAVCRDISEKGISLLYAEIKKLISEAAKRTGPNQSGDLVLPVSLPEHPSSQGFESFNRAVDEFFSAKKKPVQGKKKEKVLRAMEKQESAIKRLGKDILLEKQAGDLISAEANEINGLIKAVNSAKKKQSLEEIKDMVSRSAYSKRVLEIRHDKLVLDL